MKEFTYYNNVKIPYPKRSDIIKEIIAKLDNIPLTKAERVEKEAGAVKEGELVFKEKLAEYNRESNNLKEEFWKDCREEFGYDSFLTKKGCEILEAKAWSEGHSCGHSDVYNCLCELSEFASDIIGEKR